MNRILIEKLQKGEKFIRRGKGNSMTPLFKSGQPVELEPCTWEQANVGDAVFCKVKGMTTTHLVTAKNEKKGCQISNNHGHVNGWTKTVYGDSKPDGLDHEYVPHYKKIKNWLLIIFDGFEEICDRLSKTEEGNND